MKTKKLLLIFVFLFSCTKDPAKMYLVFLDYTLSSPTFLPENKTKIESMIEEMARTLTPEDELMVYPVHAYTESAGPILKIRGLRLKGDLRDKKRRLAWEQNMVKTGIKDMWKKKISRDRRLHTNLFPVLGKIQNARRNGFLVRPVIVSDMVQDNKKESFGHLFVRPGFDVKKYAQQKAKEFGYSEQLQGVRIVIRIPSTPHGHEAFEEIKSKVEDFWYEYFLVCGADVIIDEL